MYPGEKQPQATEYSLHKYLFLCRVNHQQTSSTSIPQNNSSLGVNDLVDVHTPNKTTHPPSVCFNVGPRLRRWPNIKPTPGGYVVSPGLSVSVALDRWSSAGGSLVNYGLPSMEKRREKRGYSKLIDYVITHNEVRQHRWIKTSTIHLVFFSSTNSVLYCFVDKSL